MELDVESIVRTSIVGEFTDVTMSRLAGARERATIAAVRATIAFGSRPR